MTFARYGANAVDTAFAQAISEMMLDFLQWEPNSPANPKALAEMLAPICHILRTTDVLAALENPQSDIWSTLAQDWGSGHFSDSDDKQFADAYAQTLTYALLLARQQEQLIYRIRRRRNHCERASTPCRRPKVLGDDAAHWIIFSNDDPFSVPHNNRLDVILYVTGSVVISCWRA